MMSALIVFVRELGVELIQRADAIDGQPKEDLGHDGMLVVLATATTLRHIAGALAAAAKRTLLA